MSLLRSTMLDHLCVRLANSVGRTLELISKGQEFELHVRLLSLYLEPKTLNSISVINTVHEKNIHFNIFRQKAFSAKLFYPLHFTSLHINMATYALCHMMYSYTLLVAMNQRVLNKLSKERNMSGHK